MNVLFVCSRNQWRSPTAERVWRNRAGLTTRSAGTSRSARRRVSAQDIAWADVIMVMEYGHKAQLRKGFGEALRGKPLHVLDIPDEYRFMAPALVEQLEGVVPQLLGFDA